MDTNTLMLLMMMNGGMNSNMFLIMYMMGMFGNTGLGSTSTSLTTNSLSGTSTAAWLPLLAMTGGKSAMMAIGAAMGSIPIMLMGAMKKTGRRFVRRARTVVYNRRYYGRRRY